MITLTVDIRASAGHLEPFLAAIEENSLRTQQDEPGCVSFDVVQDVDDDHRFLFHEVYLDEEALQAHREAPHFFRWREAVAAHVEPGSQKNTVGRRILFRS